MYLSKRQRSLVNKLYPRPRASFHCAFRETQILHLKFLKVSAYIIFLGMVFKSPLQIQSEDKPHPRRSSEGFDIHAGQDPYFLPSGTCNTLCSVCTACSTLHVLQACSDSNTMKLMTAELISEPAH